MSKSKYPYFPFYPGDFSADGKVEAMTTTEVGAYILLLCKAWFEDPPGSIPNNDRLLARWTRLTPGAWEKCRTGVLAAFTLGDDDRYHQKRLRTEYSRMREYQADKSRAGRAGAQARWQTHGNAMAMPLAPPMANDGSSPPPPEQQRERETGARLPTLDAVKEKAKLLGYPEADAVAFWNHFEASGWIDKNGHQIVNWEAKLATWMANVRAKPAEESHRAGNGQKHPRGETIWEKTKRIEIKQKRVDALKNQGSTDNFGTLSIKEKDREEYRKLKAEIRELEKQIAG